MKASRKFKLVRLKSKMVPTAFRSGSVPQKQERNCALVPSKRREYMFRAAARGSEAGEILPGGGAAFFGGGGDSSFLQPPGTIIARAIADTSTARNVFILIFLVPVRIAPHSLLDDEIHHSFGHDDFLDDGVSGRGVLDGGGGGCEDGGLVGVGRDFDPALEFAVHLH